eukprot:CAMPEP_0168621414 /NCGR_PEP_ID=MMETSP0449_2-20121227/7678_1 /TAXON_ID=1082188 /ORGANISM="Strombidium rassoulzadegani, Strain ras09" /LENGTH=108 /DNA_ID=CAMNT_0008662525 /DNA_START=140 /DNA_END=466 /DNA_ORIENTATION=+
MQGYEPYSVSMLSGRIDINGSNTARWTNSQNGQFRVCMELGYPGYTDLFREKIRFNRNGEEGEWDSTSQSEKIFNNDYKFCSYPYSDSRMVNATNQVRTQAGEVSVSN